MPDKHDVPPGFVPLSDPDAGATEFTIINVEEHRTGSMVAYHGVREWQSGNGEQRRVHTFRWGVDNERSLHGIWSTAMLDRLLKQVKVGELVFLRYDGKVPHPTFTSRTIHQWTVARAAANSESAPTPPVSPGRLM